MDRYSTAQHYFLGNWRVETAASLLCRDKQSIHLEPKVMDVLNYFVSHQDELVTRDALERDVWRGAVVGYDSVTSAVIKLRRALGDDARNPKYIATVPKRGYRLIAPVTQPGGDIMSGSALMPTERRVFPKGRGKSERVSRWVAPLLMVFIVLGLLLLQSQGRQETSTSQAISEQKLSILVVPFTNLSDDLVQDFFSEGITEDLITDLSRLSNLRLIASNLGFFGNNAQIDPKKLGERFNVDYLLLGSVRRSGDDLRVNARLVDTVSGVQIWASRYDRRLAEVFSAQDELTSNIVQALALRLTPKERELLARKATDNPQAYALFLDGQRLSRITTRESNEAARLAYQQAIMLDSGYGRAYGALAYNMALSYRRGWTEMPEETLVKALELAKEGVLLDSTIPQTYWSLGYVYLMHREFTNAMKAAKDAVAVAPNFGDGYGLMALIHNNLGEAEEAVDMIKEGMRINPYFTWDYIYNLGRAYYLLGRYEEAIPLLTEAIERNEFSIVPRLYLAACYVRVGHREDAAWQVDQISVLNPASTLSHTRKAFPIKRPEMMSALVEDLRQAGLPE